MVNSWLLVPNARREGDKRGAEVGVPPLVDGCPILTLCQFQTSPFATQPNPENSLLNSQRFHEVTFRNSLAFEDGLFAILNPLQFVTPWKLLETPKSSIPIPDAGSPVVKPETSKALSPPLTPSELCGRLPADG